LARGLTAEFLQGLGGKLLFPEATSRCTKLSILLALVSVNNRFPPNGNVSTPLSFSTSSSTLANPFAYPQLTPSTKIKHRKWKSLKLEFFFKKTANT
jgi:hypothetical protein